MLVYTPSIIVYIIAPNIYDYDTQALIEKFLSRCVDFPTNSKDSYSPKINETTVIVPDEQVTSYFHRKGDLAEIFRMNESNSNSVTNDDIIRSTNMMPTVNSVLNRVVPNVNSVSIEAIDESKSLENVTLQNVLQYPFAKGFLSKLSAARKHVVESFGSDLHVKKDTSEVTPDIIQSTGTTGDPIVDSLILKHHKIALGITKPNLFNQGSSVHQPMLLRSKLVAEEAILPGVFRHNMQLPSSIASIRVESQVENDELARYTRKEIAAQIGGENYRVQLEIKNNLPKGRRQSYLAPRMSVVSEKMLILKAIPLVLDSKSLELPPFQRAFESSPQEHQMSIVVSRAELDIIMSIAKETVSMMYFDSGNSSDLVNSLLPILDVVKLRNRLELVISLDCYS